MSWSDRSTITWPPPSIRAGTTGATTRPWRARSPTTAASTAATPAGRAAWPWRCRRRTLKIRAEADGELWSSIRSRVRGSSLELGGQEVSVEQTSRVPTRREIGASDISSRPNRRRSDCWSGSASWVRCLPRSRFKLTVNGQPNGFDRYRRVRDVRLGSGRTATGSISRTRSARD